MAVSRFDSVGETRLSVIGSAQIGDAEAIAGELHKDLDSKIPLVIMDLGGISELDVSFFQILLAMNVSLLDQGRHLKIVELPPDHPVMLTASLLGIDLCRYISVVEQ